MMKVKGRTVKNHLQLQRKRKKRKAKKLSQQMMMNHARNVAFRTILSQYVPDLNEQYSSYWRAVLTQSSLTLLRLIMIGNFLMLHSFCVQNNLYFCFSDNNPILLSFSLVYILVFLLLKDTLPTSQINEFIQSFPFCCFSLNVSSFPLIYNDISEVPTLKK